MLVFTFEQYMELEQQSQGAGQFAVMGTIFFVRLILFWGVILEFCLESTEVVEPLCSSVLQLFFILTFTVAIVHLEIFLRRIYFGLYRCLT